MINTRHQRAKRGGGKGLLVIVALGICVLVIPELYYRRHRPLIRAEAAVAEKEGEAKFEALGVPPGGVPRGPGEKWATRESSQASTKRLTWQREYNVPGVFEVAQEWYRRRLLADGWREDVSNQSSELVHRYRKEKWLVTISKRAFFEYPKEVRVHLQLEWYYWAPQS